MEKNPKDFGSDQVKHRRPATLAAAFDRTVAALPLKEADTAAIAAGRRIAVQIDRVSRTGSPLEVTKALYLIPHLMNVLEKLGGTPHSRDEILGAAPPMPPAPKPEPQKNDLEAFKQRAGIA